MLRYANAAGATCIDSKESARSLIYTPKTTAPHFARILEEDGRLNVTIKQIPNKTRRYALDLGNTLISMRWRCLMLSMVVATAFFYLLFACCWYALAYYNDDFHKKDGEPGVCIVNTRHFTGYLLLSIETHTTTGFGYIFPDCLHSWWILAAQTFATFAIEGALVAAVYAKMSRPIKREGGIFSAKGIVCMRDGRMCLVFRLYDAFSSYWMMSNVRAFFITKRSAEFYMSKLQIERCELIAGPVDVVHVITPNSPLWTWTAADFLSECFEIVVTVNGDSATTGHTHEAKKSYTCRDIIWGGRFAPCVTYDDAAGHFAVDGERFHATIMCETPLCSGAQLAALITDIDQYQPPSTSASTAAARDDENDADEVVM